MGTEWLVRLIPAAYRYSGVAWLANRPAADRLFLAAFFAYKRWVEDPFANLAKRRPELFAGGDILDVGANAGYTAALFARVASPGARVFAFEPEPLNFRRLQRVSTSEAIVAERLAIGASEGSVELAINPTHPGDHRIATGVAGGKRIQVPMTTIDRYVHDRQIGRVKFVKIDVQGYELEVSRGMTDLLEREREVAVAFELAPADLRAAGVEPEALLDFYRERGFALELLPRDGVTRPYDAAEVAARAARRGYVDLLATR